MNRNSDEKYAVGWGLGMIVNYIFEIKKSDKPLNASNLKSNLKFMKGYHIILSMLFFSLWYQTMWKKQLGTLLLPHIKFSCIIKLVSYPLLKWHPAPLKKLTKVTVHACTMFESQLAQVYQKLISYTVEPNKFTQAHLCPELNPNKLF